MTRIMGVISGKGGVGKTTLAANLGAVMASRFNKKVIVVDCNLTTSHLGLHLGMFYYPISLNHALSGKARIDEAIYNYSVKGMQIVPASLSVDEMHGADMAELSNVLRGLKNRADIIILDSAPGLGREAMSCLKASNEIIFVSTPYMPPMVDVVKCFQTAQDMGKRSLGIVLNMVGEGSHEMREEEVEELVGLPVISRIPREKHVLRSLSANVPFVDLHPRSKASKEIVKLAANILGEDEKPSGRFSGIVNFFRKNK